MFIEVFRLANATRVNVDNKNACVQYFNKEYSQHGTTRKESRADAYNVYK